jgi:hypothetical protein
MEGNLVDEDLGKQSITSDCRRKAGCGTGSGVQVLSATYVLTFNDEAKTSWKMRRQLNSQENRLWNWQDETEQTTNKPLQMFECLWNTNVFPMLTHPFCFSQIMEDVLANASCSAKISRWCHGNDRSSSYGDRWSNSFEFHYMRDKTYATEAAHENC